MCRRRVRLHDNKSGVRYARAWYAHRKADGAWSFGPSKFVGYEGLNAEAYLQAAEESDGRRTEAQLHPWFSRVDSGTPLHEELRSALFAFLAKYGKAPSTKMRIGVLRERRRIDSGTFPDEAPNEAHRTVVDLMVAVAKALPTIHFQSLREQLNNIA